MIGRRRAGAHAPRHARPSRVQGVALLAAAAIAALSGAVLLSSGSASAEAGNTTATLTLTGVRDSNCDFQTGGTDVYVKPGGDVTFKAELAGISVKVPVLGTIPLSSSAITSFNDKLVIDAQKKHPHLVNNTTSFVFKDVSAGTHKIAWTANSINVTVPVLGGILGGITGHKSITVPLNADTVLPSSLPVGGQLNWVGSVKATTDTKCGISIEVPGGGVTVGPIHVSIPPITNIPTISVPNLPSIPGLPGGGSSSTPSHPGSGGGTSKPPAAGGTTVSGLPTSIPELVVPNAGSGGGSAFGGHGVGFSAAPDTGTSYGQIEPVAVTSTAPAPNASSSPAKAAGKPVQLATDATDGGLGGAQLPVLLAIVAIIALSLVTATYARMYLLRRS